MATDRRWGVIALTAVGNVEVTVNDCIYLRYTVMIAFTLAPACLSPALFIIAVMRVYSSTAVPSVSLAFFFYVSFLLYSPLRVVICYR